MTSCWLLGMRVKVWSQAGPAAVIRAVEAGVTGDKTYGLHLGHCPLSLCVSPICLLPFRFLSPCHGFHWVFLLPNSQPWLEHLGRLVSILSRLPLSSPSCVPSLACLRSRQPSACFRCGVVCGGISVVYLRFRWCELHSRILLITARAWNPHHAPESTLLLPWLAACRQGDGCLARSGILELIPPSDPQGSLDTRDLGDFPRVTLMPFPVVRWEEPALSGVACSLGKSARLASVSSTVHSSDSSFQGTFEVFTNTLICFTKEDLEKQLSNSSKK